MPSVILCIQFRPLALPQKIRNFHTTCHLLYNERQKREKRIDVLAHLEGGNEYVISHIAL